MFIFPSWRVRRENPIQYDLLETIAVLTIGIVNHNRNSRKKNALVSFVASEELGEPMNGVANWFFQGRRTWLHKFASKRLVNPHGGYPKIIQDMDVLKAMVTRGTLILKN